MMTVQESPRSGTSAERASDGTARGSVKMLVRSKKIPVRVERLSTQVPGMGYAESTYVPIYGYVLDDGQLEFLRRSRELAGVAGLRLEVTDLTREGLLKQLLLRGRFGLRRLW